MTVDEARREQARERQRRFRERQSRGAIVRPFELCPQHVEALIGLGYLRAMDADSLDAIDAAFRKSINDWLGTDPVTRYDIVSKNTLDCEHEHTTLEPVRIAEPERV